MIYNPAAGQRDCATEVDEVVAFLASKGWDVTVRRTLGHGDATTYAREAVAHQCDVAIVAGGDGTIGQVASGLAGSHCALGVLPIGTGNVWAHMLQLPLWSPKHRTALMEAAQVLFDGHIVSIDLGKAGDRYFVLWTGVGFDAQVAHDVEPHRDIRRNLGNLTYYVTALAVSMGLRGTRLTVVIDGRAIRKRVLLIVVTNGQLYGSSWRLAPEARIDDGLVEVYVFKGSNTVDVFRHLAMLLLGKHSHDPRVDTYRAKTVEIRGEKSVPLHLDGDPAGYTPVTITVAPKALRVIVPPWTSTSLFEEPSAPTDRP